MYDTARKRHHGAKCAGAGMEGRSCGVHNRQSDSDSWPGGEGVHRSFGSVRLLYQQARQKLEGMYQAACVDEQLCALCLNSLDENPSLAQVLLKDELLCDDCKALLKPMEASFEWKGIRLFVLYEQDEGFMQFWQRYVWANDTALQKVFLHHRTNAQRFLRKYPLVFDDDLLVPLLKDVRYKKGKPKTKSGKERAGTLVMTSLPSKDELTLQIGFLKENHIVQIFALYKDAYCLGWENNLKRKKRNAFQKLR